MTFGKKEEHVLNLFVGLLSTLKQPKNLITRINVDLDEDGLELMDEKGLFELLTSTPEPETELEKVTSANVNLSVFATKFAMEKNAAWSSCSERTPERYLEVLRIFGFSEDSASAIAELIPGPIADVTGVYDGSRTHWYGDSVRNRNSFYWDSYLRLLTSRPWLKADALLKLDDATTKIVGQLEDPTVVSFPSRGLVVGHVQSGKTQNFAGVIAKAIDAGYRIVIVLSGNTEPLRRQTQRRLDMEIVGVENILGGITKDSNPSAYSKIDYVSSGNVNFPEKFIRHDENGLKVKVAPRIHRQTSSIKDFAGHHASDSIGIATNNFKFQAEIKDPSLPINDWTNLANIDVRFVVIKKQKDNLKKLIANIHGNLTAAEKGDIAQIPALIIDDESDQASINTKRPKDPVSPEDEAEEQQEREDRTAINNEIVKLLTVLPRAQYVAYTATPFANVLINPDDPDDLFPRQFIIPLEAPDAYMGASSFHDINEVAEEDLENPAVSNKAAFIREFEPGVDGNDGLALQNAIDSFVLSGAIKMWRSKNGSKIDTRHHTMLVHVSHLTEVAKKITDDINENVWGELDHTSPVGLSRLRDLFHGDFMKITNARAESKTSDSGIDFELPAKFEDLYDSLAEALGRIQDGKVAMMVNSKTNDVAFETKSTWKILVGGNLLSRGFTIEGLTVSYFERAAKTQDTLMQMGRWFGYRPGYADLVRVYLPSKVLWRKGSGKRPDEFVNINDLFTKTSQVEEAFREQVALYGSISPEDGVSQIRPIDIPPLVYRAAPELMPVSRVKMHYAEVDFAGQGGRGYDLHEVSPLESGCNRSNFELVRSHYESLMSTEPKSYLGIRQGSLSTGMVHELDLGNGEIIDLVSKISFAEGFRRDSVLALINKAINEDGLERWVLVTPAVDEAKCSNIEGTLISVLNKKRSTPGGSFTRSSEWIRSAIERASGRPEPISSESVAEKQAVNVLDPKTGALLITFTVDKGSAETSSRANLNAKNVSSLDDIATLLTFSLPYAWSPKGMIGYRVKKTKQPIGQNEVFDFKVIKDETV